MSKVEDALEVIKGMTILELRDLNKAIEEEFGVTAAAPVAMAMAPAGGEGGGAAAVEEKDEFDVILKDFGANKINVIKVVRELTLARSEGREGPRRGRSEGRARGRVEGRGRRGQDEARRGPAQPSSLARSRQPPALILGATADDPDVRVATSGRRRGHGGTLGL